MSRITVENVIFAPILVDPDLTDIIPDFIENTLKDYDQLKLYQQQADIQNIKKICHRILGTALSYGFTQLNDIVLKIQDAAKDGQIDKLQSEFEILTLHVEYIKKQFN
jgi:HPt (histidine-containing phosphotransfer) domain-containing protein